MFNTIIALLKKRRKPRLLIEQSSSHLLKKLADDLLLLIVDCLGPTESILLAQTCRRLRCVVGIELASQVRAMPPTERSPILIKLRELLPYHHYCTRCCGLHSVQVEEVPGLNRQGLRPGCVPVLGAQDMSIFKPGCTISFEHVQLAMKYRRLGNPTDGNMTVYFEKT